MAIKEKAAVPQQDPNYKHIVRIANVDLPGNKHHHGKDDEQADAAHDEGIILKLKDDKEITVKDSQNA